MIAAHSNAPSPTVMTTVTRSDQTVDLTLRIFTHSAPTAAKNVPRAVSGRGSAARSI
jgi:hypothetical protein